MRIQEIWKRPRAKLWETLGCMFAKNGKFGQKTAKPEYRNSPDIHIKATFAVLVRNTITN